MPSAPGENKSQNQGSNAGNQSEDNEGEGQPQYVTKEQVSQIVNGIVNSAITARDKRNEANLNSRFDEFKSILSGLQQKPSSQQQQAQGEDQNARQAQDDGATKLMKAKIEELDLSLKKERELRQQIESKRLQDNAETALRSKLSEKLRPEAVGLVIDAMRARGQIAVSEDGRPLLKIPFSATKGVKPELTEFEIDDGFEHLLKAPEFAVLLPPPSTGGSGAGQPRRPGASSFKNKPRDQWTADEEAAYFSERARENSSKLG